MQHVVFGQRPVGGSRPGDAGVIEIAAEPGERPVHVRVDAETGLGERPSIQSVHPGSHPDKGDPVAAALVEPAVGGHVRLFENQRAVHADRVAHVDREAGGEPVVLLVKHLHRLLLVQDLVGRAGEEQLVAPDHGHARRHRGAQTEAELLELAQQQIQLQVGTGLQHIAVAQPGPPGELVVGVVAQAQSQRRLGQRVHQVGELGLAVVQLQIVAHGAIAVHGVDLLHGALQHVGGGRLAEPGARLGQRLEGIVRVVAHQLHDLQRPRVSLAVRRGARRRARRGGEDLAEPGQIRSGGVVPLLDEFAGQVEVGDGKIEHIRSDDQIRHRHEPPVLLLPDEGAGLIPDFDEVLQLFPLRRGGAGDVDGDDRWIAPLAGDVHGDVVEDAAVHQQHAIQFDGGEHRGDRNAGAHGLAEATAAECVRPAVPEVGGHAAEWAWQPVEVVHVLHARRGEGAIELLDDALAGDDARRQVQRPAFQVQGESREPAGLLLVVVHQPPVRFLADQVRVVHGQEEIGNLLAGVAGAVQRTHQRPGAGADHGRRFEPLLLQDLEHADVRQSAGAAPAEHQADAAPARGRVVGRPGAPPEQGQRQQSQDHSKSVHETSAGWAAMMAYFITSSRRTPRGEIRRRPAVPTGGSVACGPNVICIQEAAGDGGRNQPLSRLTKMTLSSPGA